MGRITWWWTSRFLRWASPLSSPPRWWRKSPGSGPSSRATSLAGAFQDGGASLSSHSSVSARMPGSRPGGAAVGGPFRGRGRGVAEPLQRVGEDAGLVVVDPDRRRDVHGGDEDEALADAGLLDGALDVVGDAHELAALVGLEGEVGGMRSHGRASCAQWTSDCVTACAS